MSTTAGLRRAKKGCAVNEASASTSHSTKESDGSSRSSAYGVALTSSIHGDAMHVSCFKVLIDRDCFRFCI